MNRFAAALGSLAAFGVALPAALAQPIYPAAPPPPVSLDPSTPAAPPTPPPAPAPAPAPAPQVIVVGPDGKITPAQNPSEPTNYYIGDGTPPPVDEPSVIQGGPVPELHVVRRGDTLWDICFLYFNDPWQWPKIWSYNPQITNPHWIYPGDLVRLLPRGVFAQLPTSSEGNTAPPAAAPAAAPATASTTAPAAAPVDALPAPQRRIEVGIKQTAFVEKSDLDQSITIDGGIDEKILFGNSDQVYLSYPPGKPPRAGDRYSIYVPGNVVKSGGSEVGAYVHVLGTLEVLSVKQDKQARGVILEANREIERGAKVGPLLKTFKTVPPSPPKVDAQGTVVAMLTYDQLVGQGEVVFIDLGKRSGVEVGNRMYVVRRGDAYPQNMNRQVGQDDRRFPARALGEIVVVDVGDKISVGLVTLAVQEMSAGDIVVMQASK